jgi:4-hydroxythreonine-4-phosphate dehydrogenase
LSNPESGIDAGPGLPPMLAVTSGEPAGIGPELCLALAGRTNLTGHPARLVVLGDARLLAERAGRLGLSVALAAFDPARPPAPGALEVLDIPLVAACQAGRPDPANGAYVLALLDRALAGCKSGEFAGMVTAPVHKGAICESGVLFSGHTEYLAAATATPRVVMMLVGGGLRVALTTTHLPLAEVPAAITREVLTETLEILHHDLVTRFGLGSPRILVAGLNPHAGEGGHMGREEIEVITPVLEQLRARGMALVGPLPADTLFVPHTLALGDAVLAMYHDQGLPVLKHASFGGGVNVTLGLPIVRTSVDHGTALDLAGTGRADPGSLFAAVELAAQLATELPPARR